MEPVACEDGAEVIKDLYLQWGPQLTIGVGVTALLGSRVFG